LVLGILRSGMLRRCGNGGSWLFLQLVLALEALHSTGGIHYPLLAGVERMTLPAKFHPQLLYSGAGGKGVAAGADHPGIVVVLGMDFLFHSCLVGVNADLSLALGCWFVFHGAVDKGEDGVVFAHAHVIAWMNAGAALANQYSTGEHLLAAVSFDAQALGLAIAPAACAAAALLMCH